jgi:hypothetical protein
MGTAARLVAVRGKSFLNMGKYPTVTVWSKQLTEVDLLRESFGGNYYIHGVGYTWVISKRDQICRMWKWLQGALKENPNPRLCFIEDAMALKTQQ